jgi:hypothetical protein
LTDDYSNVSPGLNSQSIITVVRDPDRTLGKQFTLNSDGSINKQSVVNLAFGMARMHVVETPQELADLIRDTSEDTHAAIINASFVGSSTAIPMQYF